jgi:hypothetical protein
VVSSCFGAVSSVVTACSVDSAESFPPQPVKITETNNYVITNVNASMEEYFVQCSIHVN